MFIEKKVWEKKKIYMDDSLSVFRMAGDDFYDFVLILNNLTVNSRKKILIVILHVLVEN